jgi:hypothetical protein
MQDKAMRASEDFFYIASAWLTMIIPRISSRERPIFSLLELIVSKKLGKLA